MAFKMRGWNSKLISNWKATVKLYKTNSSKVHISKYVESLAPHKRATQNPIARVKYNVTYETNSPNSRNR